MATPIPDEQASLLAAIVANPDDDTARLVYADWLQEHDDEEQAVFIRDSIRLAAMERSWAWEKLADRLRETRNWRSPEWLAKLGFGKRVAGFERGMPVRVTFEGANEFFAVADRLFALTPIRALEIHATNGSYLDDDGVRRLASMPDLARIRDLRLLEHYRAPNVWQALFHSPHVSGLEFLGLSGCRINGWIAWELASAPSLASLASLDLSYNSIGVFGARAILNSQYLRRLELLWLEHNFFGDEEGAGDILESLERWLGEGLRTHSSPVEEDDDEI